MSLLDDLGRSSEALILQRARDGDGAAFGALYERHLGAARRLARSLVADHSDADDVVAEVFAAAFAAMRRGSGPVDDFRSYLLTSIRRECRRTWRRGARQRPGGDIVVELASARSSDRDDFGWCDEGDVVHRAFAALAPRMQHVLWLTEIEGLSHEEVAIRIGASSTAVAQLARRARLQFGERYLDEHLPARQGPVPAACAAPRRVLAEVVRGTASRRAERLAADHMATCTACSDAEIELQVVNGRLRTGHALALLPALAVSKPARAGLLARLVAWIAGPVPTMSAVATLAIATAVAPHPVDGRHHITANAPPVATTMPAATAVPGTDPVLRSTPATDIDPGAVDSGAVEPITAEPDDPPSSTRASVPEPAVVPTGDAVSQAPVAVDPGAVAAGQPGVPALPLPSVLPTTPAPPDVAATLEDVVNGVRLDDPLVGAADPILAALPRVDVAVTVPPAAVELGAGGQVDAGVGIGPAHVGASVGGDGGAHVALPAVPEAVAALPAPVPFVLDDAPGVGTLLGD